MQYFEDVIKTMPPQIMLVRQYFKHTGGPPPAMPTLITGALAASVSWGRWVVQCSACPCALNASREYAYFICYRPGCPEFGIWKAVTFPTERANIERLLARRPPRYPGLPTNRNWRPGERVSDLQRENREHGIDDSLR